MKSIRDYIAQDMWGHILMSGPDIRGCVSGSMYQTPEEKRQYCQGIMTVFPHMLLGNFSRWLWDSRPPKEYEPFMDSSMKDLQDKVFPVLDTYFLDTENADKGSIMAALLTDVIPKHMLTGFYQYMFGDTPEYQDISGYWNKVEPLLALTARMVRCAYLPDAPLPLAEKEELYLYIGTQLPYLLLKRWYDWQFGEEKIQMP